MREVAVRDGVAGRGAGALQPLHLAGQVGDDVGDGAVLELGAGPAEQPLRLVLEADPLAAGLEVRQALLGAGLVDQLNLQIFPLVLGSGFRLYPESPDKLTLDLEASEYTPNGVLLNEYVVGAPSDDA